MLNLPAAIAWHARVRPDALALVYEDERVSYRELTARIDAAAAVLAGRGIGRGDVVAALMKNSIAFIELAAAVSHLGAVFLPINYRLARAEVGYILDHAGARLLVVDEELAAQADPAFPQIVLDAAGQRDLRRVPGAGSPPPPVSPCGPQDLYRLMYTSGTTGHPKGVTHTYENAHAKALDHLVALGLSSATRLLVTGPLYHVGAFELPGVTVLMAGGMLCILRDYDPARVLGLIERERLTGAWLAPVMLNGLLGLPDAARFDLSSLAWCIGGGERTPEPRIRAFGELFRNGRYVDAYGLTESVSGDTFMEPGREIEKIGSTGRPTPHVELRIVDPEGRSLPAGSEGEICLRGPKITRGYWRDPAQTAASFFGDWFRTGDVGLVDDEGFLYLTDRLKDMIISGGENIASSEVERVIYELPQVAEAAVIGVPDPRWGEVPHAVVVLKAGTALEPAAFTAHCRAALAGFKVPKGLHLRTALPRNASGKVLKRVLRAELMDERTGERTGERP